jgi:hypothetical protein
MSGAGLPIQINIVLAVNLPDDIAEKGGLMS